MREEKQPNIWHPPPWLVAGIVSLDNRVWTAMHEPGWATWMPSPRPGQTEDQPLLAVMPAKSELPELLSRRCFTVIVGNENYLSGLARQPCVLFSRRLPWESLDTAGERAPHRTLVCVVHASPTNMARFSGFAALPSLSNLRHASKVTTAREALTRDTGTTSRELGRLCRMRCDQVADFLRPLRAMRLTMQDKRRRTHWAREGSGGLSVLERWPGWSREVAAGARDAALMQMRLAL